MTHQRVVEIWKQLEEINNSTVPLLDELDKMYNGKYTKEIAQVLEKYYSVQTDLALIDMRSSYDSI